MSKVKKIDVERLLTMDRRERALEEQERQNSECPRAEGMTENGAETSGELGGRQYAGYGATRSGRGAGSSASE
ncbi:hypothetical protein CKO15_09815 [Halorhodospira abdelmalekii]|uniref:hypothetical protein n=1 Tax=Halorhodospira abdelmalekii TaxID=421629 RepID=UPI0019032584|nr:hypothetical protein [Halorhodospira abdelmalekii]MBK1735574.1 hypothetical protein [Halorhodospira abdelmalekii]